MTDRRVLWVVERTHNDGYWKPTELCATKRALARRYAKTMAEQFNRVTRVRAYVPRDAKEK